MTEQVCYPKVKNIGLRDIPVADTRISVVDGVQGELQYRGFSIQDLAGQATFEEVVYLLFYGKLPSNSQLDLFSSQLREARAPAPEILKKSLFVFFPLLMHSNRIKLRLLLITFKNERKYLILL